VTSIKIIKIPSPAPPILSPDCEKISSSDFAYQAMGWPMDCLKFHPGLPLLKQPDGHLRGGPPTGLAACGRLLPHSKHDALRLCLPTRGDVIRVSPFVRIDASSESEITQLQNVVGGYQKIFWRKEFERSFPGVTDLRGRNENRQCEIPR
jgi:hypothetical protein